MQLRAARVLALSTVLSMGCSSSSSPDGSSGAAGGLATTGATGTTGTGTTGSTGSGSTGTGSTGSTTTGGTPPPTRDGEVFGDVHSGNYNLGPVDFAETQWHNACAPYPAQIQ